MSLALKRFENYSKSDFPNLKENFAELANGQSPEILFITCSDSRVMPTEMTQTKAGELFVIRNAGNLVPKNDGTSTSEALTIEYAVSVLGVKEIVICGHVKCGAMDGILNLDKLTGLKCVHSHLEKCSHDLDKSVVDSKDLPNLIEHNVETQMRHLMGYDFVKAKVESGELNIYGWVYDFVNGKLVSQKNIKEVL